MRVESIRIARRTQVVIVGKIWWYRLSSKNVSIMFRYYFFFDALRYVHERTLTYKDFPNINSITFGSHNGIPQAKNFPFLYQVVPFILKFRHFLSFPYHINFPKTNLFLRLSSSQLRLMLLLQAFTTTTISSVVYWRMICLSIIISLIHQRTVAMVTVPFTKPELIENAWLKEEVVVVTCCSDTLSL